MTTSTSTAANTEKKPKSPKKRKRATAGKPKKAPVAPTTAPPPSSILIIDNGGDTLKYGWAQDDGEPQSMSNMTARLRYQINMLSGDEIETVKPNQLESTTRSMERGHVTNLGNQIQVWKRVMDKLRIAIPIHSGNSAAANRGGEAAQTFGWKISRNNNTATPPVVQSKNIAVLLLIQPHCPRVVIDSMLQVWMEDFGVSHVGFAISGSFAALSYKSQLQGIDDGLGDGCGCCCVVDAGWGATHVIPTYEGKVLDGIRRVPLGGRHFLNLWRYYVSYRQWNLMDQEWILRDVQHRLAFFSMDFTGDMKQARRVPLGKRPWDRDYVLPDMQTSNQGEIRLAAGLQRAIEEEKKKSKDETDQTDTGDEDDDEDDEDHDGQEESNEDDNSEEETEEDVRRRVIRQRQEEERRRREMEAEQQVLSVSVERFAIPEVLFTPSDADLPRDMAGLPHAIVQSIEACPRIYQAALYRSLYITGGVAQIPNFQHRLEREVRALAPSQYKVRVLVSNHPVQQSWFGAREWIRQTEYTQWSVSRDEWEKSKRDPKKSKCWHRLLVANGGSLM